MGFDIMKIKMNDGLSTASGSLYGLATSELSSQVYGSCTNGTHLFVVGAQVAFGNPGVAIFLCSDLSYLDAITTFNGSDRFYTPRAVAMDSTYLYASDKYTGNNKRVVRFALANILVAGHGYAGEFQLPGIATSDNFEGLDVDDNKIYVSLSGVMV